MSPNIKKYAKAVAAGAGFVALVASQLATGNYDLGAILGGVISLLTVLGVYAVPNKNA